MIPNTLNLPTIWRGCDWGPVTLKWKDANGQPLNVISWTPLAQSLNVNLRPVKVNNGVAGETKIALTAAQTLHLKLGTEKWDWIWQTNDGSYRFPPFLAGKIAIKEPVVRLPGDRPRDDAPGDDTQPPGITDPPTTEVPPTLPI